MYRFYITLIIILLSSCSVSAWGRQKVASEEQVFTYSRAVAAGNRSAVRELFALSTDGASAEDQDIVLGRLIPQYPRLFLDELTRSQFADCQACLPGLLGNLGDEYVDRFGAQLRELKKRRRALKSVHDKSLTALRNRCIAVLNSEIKQVMGVIRELNTSHHNAQKPAPGVAQKAERP